MTQIHQLSDLYKSSTSSRLIGTSGLGKTRLVQALFDERVGEQALDPNYAFYTDIADNPSPNPIAFAEQLIAKRTRAVLVIDNCPPELHRNLTKLIANSRSLVSLLTVEYDVRDDLPEETNVFRLEPASEEVIEKLILTRFKHISEVDAETIARLTGGNARIAIALASTVKTTETVSGLHDVEVVMYRDIARVGRDERRFLAIDVAIYHTTSLSACMGCSDSLI